MNFEILILLKPGESLISHGSTQFYSSNVVVFALGSQTMNNNNNNNNKMKSAILQYFFIMLLRKSITIFGEFYTLYSSSRLVNYFIGLFGSLHVM